MLTKTGTQSRGVDDNANIRCHDFLSKHVWAEVGHVAMGPVCVITTDVLSAMTMPKNMVSACIWRHSQADKEILGSGMSNA